MSKENEPLPYYRWQWRDYRASRKVQRMTYVERGLYRELLDECWAVGYIQNDINELADICGCPVEVMASAWQVLSKCFVENDGVLINEKLDQQRTEADKTRASRAIAGRNGGLKKQSLKANAKQVLASAKQLTYSNSNSNSNSNSRSLDQTSFERFWSAYPRKTAKQNALKAFQKLNPDESLLEKILSNIEQRRKDPSWTKDNGQYIPHGATYLNGKRWEDQIQNSQPSLPTGVAVKPFPNLRGES